MGEDQAIVLPKWTGPVLAGLINIVLAAAAGGVSGAAGGSAVAPADVELVRVEVAAIKDLVVRLEGQMSTFQADMREDQRVTLGRIDARMTRIESSLSEGTR